jgi:outer membrane protein TolC
MRDQGGATHGLDSVWQEYLAAAQELDAVRRGAAVAAAEQRETLRAAREELVTVRRRLTVQQARFAEVTGRHAVRLPTLTPRATEVNAALAPGGGPAEVLAALRAAQSTIDDADADLDAAIGSRARTRTRPAHGASFVRNLAGYVSFTLVVLVLLACAGAGTVLLLR